MNNTLSINRNVVPEVRYGRLLVFFSMPFDFENKMLNLLARDKEEGGIEKSSGSYYKYKEAAVRYPRIVIAGPSVDEPSTTAKRLVSAMQNRHRYQAHMYHTNEADGVKRFTMPPANEQASKESAYSKVTAEAIRRSLPNEKRDKKR
ncbi:hypothetical protein ADEAN_000711500 [Angomonas deanei]|uniref:Uncharacterized protein n=1 Tax=Angomonas deanei TaxID=59799 RepID=A0A7G2CIK2_9TRYP|nr:hypothetical protein ADEAN_000711500 [Angomonas deanei]